MDGPSTLPDANGAVHWGGPSKYVEREIRPGALGSPSKMIEQPLDGFATVTSYIKPSFIIINISRKSLGHSPDRGRSKKRFGGLKYLK